jgi:hypothetical protein
VSQDFSYTLVAGEKYPSRLGTGIRRKGNEVWQSEQTIAWGDWKFDVSLSNPYTSSAIDQRGAAWRMAGQRR